MDVIFARDQVTAAEVMAQLPDPPTYSTVRKLLQILEEKGHLRHRLDGPRYVYEVTLPKEQASRSALEQVLHTFFQGSLSSAVAALIDSRAGRIDAQELQRLESIVKAAKQGEAS